jgi:hypothetical protein
MSDVGDPLSFGDPGSGDLIDEREDDRVATPLGGL